MVMATYKNFIWVGVSFREGYGLTGIVGLRLGGNFRVSYAYEYPTSWGAGSSSLGSHEFYLGARLGKRDREEQFAQQYHKRDSLAQAAKALKESQEVKQTEEETEPEELAVIIPNTEQNEQVEETKTEPQTEKEVTPSPVIEEVKPQSVTNNYVVVGSYRNRQNAVSQMRNLLDIGMVPVMVYNPARQFFYVCVMKTDDRERALEELNKERDRNRFQGVWLYSEEKK
jgi:hypothetical protein